MLRVLMYEIMTMHVCALLAATVHASIHLTYMSMQRRVLEFSY